MQHMGEAAKVKRALYSLKRALYFLKEPCVFSTEPSYKSPAFPQTGARERGRERERETERERERKRKRKRQRKNKREMLSKESCMGVATVSRIDKITGLLYRIESLL